jgi:hypothetical protein
MGGMESIPAIYIALQPPQMDRGAVIACEGSGYEFAAGQLEKCNYCYNLCY